MHEQSETIAPPKEDSELLTSFESILDTALAFDEKVLRPDLGESGFSEARYWHERIQGLLRLLKEAGHTFLWKERSQVLLNCIHKIVTTYQQIEAFKPLEGNNPAQRRQELITRLNEQHSQLFELVAPILPFLQSTGYSPVEEWFQKAKEELDHLKGEAQEAVSTTHERLDTAEEILKKLQDTTGQVGVVKYASVFESESKAHGRHSIFWAIAAGILGAAAAAYTVWVVEPHLQDALEALANSDSNSPTLLIPTIISRLVIVSLLYVGVAWCLKNFSASRHNAVVNKHRQNALTTFEAFVAATEGDTQTKNAVLLQATQSIFAPQSTGYLKSEGDAPSGNQVIEIIRGLSNKPE